MKYVCELCGSIYDETVGNAASDVEPGTTYADLPEDYECPGCGFHKEALTPLQPKRTQIHLQD